MTESAVLCTTDGGLTWKSVTPAGCRLNQCARGFFMDGNRAWVGAYGDRSTLVVYRTSDGGRTWDNSAIELETVEGVAPQMQFIDPSNGWMMAHQGVAMHHEVVTLLRTTDGGKTWSVASKTDPRVFKPGEIPFAGHKTGFAFRNAEEGWITGYEPVDGTAYLLRTVDGGRTWERVSLMLPEAHKKSQLTTMQPVFFSASDGLIPVSFAGNQMEMGFYVTHDGGKAWAVGSMLKSVGEYGLVWTFASITNGFATDGTQVYVTTNGGRNWTAVKPDRRLKDVRALEFVSDKTGWAIGEGLLLKTADGGHTWAEVPARVQ